MRFQLHRGQNRLNLTMSLLSKRIIRRFLGLSKQIRHILSFILALPGCPMSISSKGFSVRVGVIKDDCFIFANCMFIA
jgi:hypothetical protein